MSTNPKRIGLVVGADFIPGINSVIRGAASAAHQLGWELVGVREGFGGLLFPDHYPQGGLLPVTQGLAEGLDLVPTCILGQSARMDPFHVRQVSDDDFVEEVDLSGEVLAACTREGLDAIVAVVGARGLSILHRLHRKGLNTVCVPRSIENDIASTQVAFGFNSVLSFTIDMLDRARQAAQAARKIAVVEVLGQQAGWLALQGGMAAGADAILIPEIPADLAKVADCLKARVNSARPYGLVVVAEGAQITGDAPAATGDGDLKAMLSPLSEGGNSQFVIRKSGQAAALVADRLQKLLPEQTYPLVLGDWSRCGSPTAVDRQLGLAYGAGAIEAVHAGENGVMTAFVPPEMKFIPLPEAINKVRTIPATSGFLKTAAALGINLGA